MKQIQLTLLPPKARLCCPTGRDGGGGGGDLVYSPRTVVCWVILIDCPLLYRISKVLSVPFSFNDLIRDPRRP